jgi:hypothetical protein
MRRPAFAATSFVSADGWRDEVAEAMSSAVPVLMFPPPPSGAPRYVSWYYPLLAEGLHFLAAPVGAGDAALANWTVRVVRSAAAGYRRFERLGLRSRWLVDRVVRSPRVATAYVAWALRHLAFFRSPRDWRMRRPYRAATLEERFLRPQRDVGEFLRRWRELSAMAGPGASPRSPAEAAPSVPSTTKPATRHRRRSTAASGTSAASEFSGGVIEVTSDGWVSEHSDVIDWKLVPFFERRVIPVMQRLVHAVRSDNVKYLHRSREVLLFVGFGDTDVFHYFNTEPASGATRLAQRLMDDFNGPTDGAPLSSPSLYFVHWNPTIVDAVNGFIGRRVVPIPDFTAVSQSYHHRPPRTSLANQSRCSVGWRGMTSGHFQNYAESDRAIAVDILGHLDTALERGDVKFNRRMQGVTEKVVPGSAMGLKSTESDMATCAFVLDVDGNSNAWKGLRWKLGSGTPVLKVRSPFVQWYYRDLQDGVHLQLWDIDAADPREFVRRLAQRAAANYTPYFEMATRAGDYARSRFSVAASLEAIDWAMRNLEYYDTPRDWRIRSRNVSMESP